MNLMNLLAHGETRPRRLPRPDHVVPEWRKRLFRRVPALQKATRAAIYTGHEGFVLGFTYRPALMAVVERRSRALMARQISEAVPRMLAAFGKGS